MSIKNTLHTAFCLLALLLVGTGSVLAQDLSTHRDGRPLFSLEPKFPANVPHLGPQIFVTAPEPPPPACACHNLAGVSVICEDCDRETDEGLCYTHDRACQDAALKGGIREHHTFFCTTPST